MRYVLDCSVAVRWFVRQPHWEVAREILVRFQAGEISLIAPDVIVPEFGHVMRKLAVGKHITADHAYESNDRFLAIPVEMVPARALAADAMRLALKHMGTFYDALYVSLAIRDDLTVLAADDRMGRSFSSLKRILALSNLNQI